MKWARAPANRKRTRWSTASVYTATSSSPPAPASCRARTSACTRPRYSRATRPACATSSSASGSEPALARGTEAGGRASIIAGDDSLPAREAPAATAPRPLSRGGTGSERGASVDRAQAVPRPAKPGRQRSRPFGRQSCAAPRTRRYPSRAPAPEILQRRLRRPRHAVRPVHRVALSLSVLPTRDKVSGRLQSARAPRVGEEAGDAGVDAFRHRVAIGARGETPALGGIRQEGGLHQDARHVGPDQHVERPALHG